MKPLSLKSLGLIAMSVSITACGANSLCQKSTEIVSACGSAVSQQGSSNTCTDKIETCNSDEENSVDSYLSCVDSGLQCAGGSTVLSGDQLTSVLDRCQAQLAGVGEGCVNIVEFKASSSALTAVSF